MLHIKTYFNNISSVSTMPELVNTESEFTIGVVDEDVYRPIIMWNLEIKSYISEKDQQFRAYGCKVKVQGKNGHLKTFDVWIKEVDFHKFNATRSAIVDQTHGELIRNSRFDHSLWSDLVPKLIEASAETIVHQRAAKNIGLAWDYLVTESRRFGSTLNPDFCEIVYKDIGKFSLNCKYMLFMLFLFFCKLIKAKLM